MEKKALLRLMVILLGLSYVVIAAAVPATRSLMSRKVDPTVQQDHLVKERKSEELFEMEEGPMAGRMVMNIPDYPGTRANPAHDPKIPGKPIFYKVLGNQGA